MNTIVMLHSLIVFIVWWTEWIRIPLKSPCSSLDPPLGAETLDDTLCEALRRDYN